ncbi:MAG: valine--tRNA ligase [Lachnospiraceae bacterium]|jgi:valyl-tRNA synthetase
MKELDKVYDPSRIEGRLYEKWEKNGYFHAEPNPKKKPFTVIMPPPNITGKLHMGHALDSTMQDAIVRYRRMQGYETLWQPGTDHAAIATEVRVTNELRKKGIEKKDLTREQFLKYCWDWRNEYGGLIVRQLKRLGASADWQRERFTMDEGCSRAVREVFVRLYEKGYIYKGNKIINWCPSCQTTISDAEVEYEEQDGHFWHIRYPIVGEEGKFVEIATTRPETMLGDTAVAVNPTDERYTDLVGKKLLLPLVNREIPVIADEYVDKEFGTGCVKITPAHDPNDFNVGKRHNLPEINILNDDGTINENGGEYAGMDRYEARKAIVKRLDEMGLLVKIEPIRHNVGTHDRCHTVVEPMIKPQWFVKMDEMAKPAIEALKNGSLKFVPESYGKTYLHWLENIQDWCISRQLIWGHRIPAWTCGDCGKMIVSREDPTECPYCGGKHLTQEDGTLDTWFSSALWPFSTLGWPDDTPEYRYFYPTDVLVTGYDIIFFWVIRMVFSGIEQTGKVPFHTVLMHGLVRDEQGRKMSKSLGNGIDPIGQIDQYGADALRMTLLTGNAPGNDMRFTDYRVKASRNFCNKIWNASRFIMMNMEEADPAAVDAVTTADLTDADRWILSKANRLASDVTYNLDHYELGIALQKASDFAWDEFCDWYIEMVKPRLHSDTDTTKAAAIWTLKTVLIQILKLLHPFIPFITEEIFCNLQDEEESIMISSWPEYRADYNFPEEENRIDAIKEAVRAIREVRTQMNVAPSRKSRVYVVSPDEETRKIFEQSRVFFQTLATASEIVIQENRDGIGSDAVSAVTSKATFYLPFADLVDIDKEIERLKKEEEKLYGELRRSQGMLSNERFLSKAPAAKIQEEKDKYADYQTKMAQVQERLEALEKHR